MRADRRVDNQYRNVVRIAEEIGQATTLGQLKGLMAKQNKELLQLVVFCYETYGYCRHLDKTRAVVPFTNWEEEDVKMTISYIIDMWLNEDSDYELPMGRRQWRDEICNHIQSDNGNVITDRLNTDQQYIFDLISDIIKGFIIRFPKSEKPLILCLKNSIRQL